MNNLFSLAKSGLSVAQSALSVVGSNLTNGMSDTYSRRSLVIGELGGMTTGNGFYGYGATVALTMLLPTSSYAAPSQTGPRLTAAWSN